jgi:hypothetical protein
VSPATAARRPQRDVLVTRGRRGADERHLRDVDAEEVEKARLRPPAQSLCRRQTQGNPIAAGLIAFGAGMLVASLLPATDLEKWSSLVGQLR